MPLYAQTFFGISLDFTNIQHSKNIYQRLTMDIIRIYFLFSVLSQTSKQLLSKFHLQKPSNYKQIWRLRPDPSCVHKKCTLIIKCFSHTICHLELTSISKTIIAFSKSANNFQRDNNIYFLNILIFYYFLLCFRILVVFKIDCYLGMVWLGFLRFKY